MSHFLNYFKNLHPVQDSQSLSIKFPVNNYFDFVSQYDLFKLQEIDLFEQELVYDLGKRLNLVIPRTSFAQILFDYSNTGVYTMKQAFDQVFLDHNHLEDSVIVMFDTTEEDEYSIKYLYDEELDEETENHLGTVLKLLKDGDENTIFKYFDINYLSRFETLRILLKASVDFVIAENLRFIYNKTRGKLYPILDEANILNMRQKGKDKNLKKMALLIKKNPAIQQKTETILARLNDQYNGIVQFHKKSLKKYRRLMNQIIYRLKINLVSDFFSKNVYKKIQNTSNPKKLKSKKFSSTPVSLNSEFFLKNHPDLKLKFKNNQIFLPAGNHTLKKSLTIPRGTALKILAGARIKVFPQVSLICHSPVYITGNGDNPVVIEPAKSDSPFGVFAFIGQHQYPSEIFFLDYSGSSNTIISGSSYTGGLYFQDMDIKIVNSKIKQIFSDSGIYTNGCSVNLKNNQFQENESDHLYLKNSQGTVKENLFIHSGDQTGTDGLKVVHSDLLVQENQFKKFPDKGIIIGQYSNCIFYKNNFLSNKMGLAVKDSSNALVFSNTFIDNQIGISSYQKNPAFKGGRLYILDNSFRDNTTNSTYDRYSIIFLLEKYINLQDEISKNIRENRDLFLASIFKQLRSRFPVQDNRIETMRIGIHQAQINEPERIIFIRLPAGSDPIQKISFKSKLSQSSVFLKPILQGITGSKNAEAEQIHNNSNYNFKNFIFFGKINLIHDYLSKEYDLYITDSNLALISINSANKSGQINQIKNEPKIPCTIDYLPSNPVHPGQIVPQKFFAKIEGRGQKWPKWKYGFILDRAAKLEGMEQAKKWVLESSFVEKSLMRSKITFDLLRSFTADSNLPGIAPQSRFVEVILNQDYQGIYLLTEHINKNFLNLENFDKNEKNNALLYRARNRNANFTTINTELIKNNTYKYFPGNRQPESKASDPIMSWHSGFAQRHPDPDQYGEYWESIEELVKFAARSSDELFQKDIFNILEMDNFINLWILIQLTDDTDGIFQNRYIARARGKKAKWYFIPWDKDGVFGRNYKMEKRPFNQLLSSPLFNRCMKMDIFKNSLIKRWQELTNTGIISAEKIFKMIEANQQTIKHSWRRNFQKWEVVASIYPDNLDYLQEIDYLKTWIKKRIEWLDKYFEDLLKK